MPSLSAMELLLDGSFNFFVFCFRCSEPALAFFLEGRSDLEAFEDEEEPPRIRRGISVEACVNICVTSAGIVRSFSFGWSQRFGRNEEKSTSSCNFRWDRVASFQPVMLLKPLYVPETLLEASHSLLPLLAVATIATAKTISIRYR